MFNDNSEEEIRTMIYDHVKEQNQKFLDRLKEIEPTAQLNWKVSGYKVRF